MISVNVCPAGRMPVQQIGIALEVDGRRGQAPPNVNRVLGKSRREREVQRYGHRPGIRLHTPPTEKSCSAGEVHRVCAPCRQDFNRTDQVEHVGHGMRSDLEHDVARLA